MTHPEELPQIARLCDVIKTANGPNIIGIYVHGSLAMGCFQPACSDIDVLVVTYELLSLATKRQLIQDLLEISKSPHPIEISFMAWGQLHPWRHPCPYDLHFSEDHRKRLAYELITGAWRQWNDMEHKDADIAAHITVAQERGIHIEGQSIRETLPIVPAADYLAALRFDVADYARLIMTNPVYCVLNCCRVLAYQRDGAIFSKAEGGAYALEHLPPRHHAIINAALNAYKGESSDQCLDVHACQEFFGVYLT